MPEEKQQSGAAEERSGDEQAPGGQARGGQARGEQAPMGSEEVSKLAEEAQKAASYVAELSAGDLIQWVIAALAEKAWERMGLVANPATGQIKRDFEDARLAIDSIGALTELLAPRMDPAGNSRLRTLLADLRINYAAQRGKAEAQ